MQNDARSKANLSSDSNRNESVAGRADSAALNSEDAHYVKPGYRTSEFWLTCLVVILSFGAEIAGLFPDRWAASIGAAVAIAYKITRLILKLQAAYLGGSTRAPRVIVGAPAEESTKAHRGGIAL
jgi:hypothetical protein